MAKFSSKNKIQAVKRYLKGTEGGKTIANSVGGHPRELYQWIKRFEFSGEKAKLQYLKQNEVSLEGSIEALQAENERLRMENDYLKKLNALVQKKKRLQTKTKCN